MGLREEIVPYIDGNGLVSPNINPGPGRGSDNGLLFTSEYFAMLQMMGDLTEDDKNQFNQKVNSCLTTDGLNRAPIGTDSDLDGPDDYYGVLNGCKHLDNTEIPRKLLWESIKYLGFLNNSKPGMKTWSSFLVRQLQLVTAMIAASFPSYWNPIHWLIRILAFPLFFYAALVIFVSCIGAPASDADSRRLSWHLLQTVKPVSLMCKFASLFWYHRLHTTYGVAGMRGVAARYYQENHPFIRYWVD